MKSMCSCCFFQCICFPSNNTSVPCTVLTPIYLYRISTKITWIKNLFYLGQFCFHFKVLLQRAKEKILWTLFIIWTNPSAAASIPWHGCNKHTKIRTQDKIKPFGNWSWIISALNSLSAMDTAGKNSVKYLQLSWQKYEQLSTCRASSVVSQNTRSRIIVAAQK